MKDIERSCSLYEAAQSKKGMFWLLELIVFVAVMLVSSFAMGIASLPLQFAALFSDADYVAATQSGDVTQIAAATMAVSQRMAESDWYTIAMLLLEIVMILLVFLFCRFVQKRKLRTLGFIKKDILKEYGIGMLTGFGMFSVCVLFGVLFGGLHIEGISPEFSIGIFVCYLAGYMVQGMAEEVICRGYFMGSYARRYPVYAAVLANALLFAALHLLNAGITPLAFINLTLFGIFASLYFVRRGSIWGIAAFHSIWNLVQGNFYGIQVSGNPLGNSFLCTTPVDGKVLANGGSFGMEGSLICTIVYLVGIVFLLTRKNKDGETRSTL